MRVTKKTLLRKIEQMEKSAAIYGVEFRTSRTFPGPPLWDVDAEYDYKKNPHHRRTSEANDDLRKGLEAAMELLDARGRYEKLRRDREKRDGFSESSIRYFLEDLLTYADAQKAKRAAAYEEKEFNNAKSRLTGKS